MNIEPGTYVRPIESPDNWECVQGVDDHGVFIGDNHHVPWPVLFGYWEYQRRDSVEWFPFPATAAACLREFVLLMEAGFKGQHKPGRIQAIIDQAIPLAGLTKEYTDPDHPPGYTVK